MITLLQRIIKADLFDRGNPRNLSIRSHHSATSRLHYWNVFWDHLPRDHHQLKTPNPEQSEQGCNLKRQYLPIYLASKPIQTKVIAWGKQILPLALASCTYLWVFVVIAGGPEKRIE